MRRQAVVFIILWIPFFSLAAAKNVQDFFVLSKKLRGEITAKMPTEKKLQKMDLLKSELETARKDFEKKNPDEGTDEEDKVNFFYYTFEPAFKLKKVTKSECEKTQEQIRFEDKTGKEEDAKLTADAEEAVEWLKLLCNNSLK